jgi:WD40 repeat protein
VPGVSLLQKPGRRAHLLEAWRFVPSEYPRGVAFDRTGALLALGAADGQLVVLDAATGASRWETRLPDSVSTVAFSPADDRLAVACFDGRTRLYRSDGELLSTLPGAKGGWVEWVAWSKRGQLATAQGRGVRVWTADGQPVLETPPHESTISGVGFSPDGSRLLTSCYGAVRLFPLEAGVEARTLSWKSSLLSLTPSPDGKVIAVATQDNSVHFWRLASGKDSEMSGYPAKPTALAWSPDSKLLCTGGGADICGWRFVGRGPEGSEPLILRGHEQPITRLAYSRQGLLASGALDGDVLTWDPAADATPIGIAPLGDEPAELAFSPDGARLCGASARQVVLWEVTHAQATARALGRQPGGRAGGGASR